MNTKLTLKLDEQIIEAAKKYASNKKMSLSKIVESYLLSLTTKKQVGDFEISPFVQNMATGKSIPLAAEEKSEYGHPLDTKYT